MEFAIIYNKNTGKIESMVVPENESEKETVNRVKLFDYQGIEKFDINRIISTEELDKIYYDKSIFRRMVCKIQ